jgi:hypothetical protein
MGEAIGSARTSWIDGSKGGAVKARMTRATLDCLPERGDKALFIECDTSSPGAWKADRGQTERELIDRDEAHAWLHFELCNGMNVRMRELLAEVLVGGSRECSRRWMPRARHERQGGVPDGGRGGNAGCPGGARRQQ